MLNTMSEAQRLMLREAAKREDRFLQPPANARAASVRTLAGRLIDAGWVKEIKARNSGPIWRKDTASGETYALKLTAKGGKAATAMIEATDGESAALVTPSPAAICAARPEEDRDAGATCGARIQSAYAGSRRSRRPALANSNPRAASDLKTRARP